METIRLFRAEEEHAPIVLDITRRAFDRYAQEVRKKEEIAALHETLGDVRRDIAEKFVYLVSVDEDVLGAVRFAVFDTHIAYLSRFSVLPEAQNLGLGGLLLEKVRLECLQMGVKAICLRTASKMRSSVAFYLKNGYYIHSISKDPDYIRAFMVNELVEMDEMFDYEGAICYDDH